MTEEKLPRKNRRNLRVRQRRDPSLTTGRCAIDVVYRQEKKI